MKKQIFFIEDDESINALIEATLKKNDFEPYGFLDPVLFLEEIKNKTPDLIVLDLMLPNISGFEVLKKLQANPLYKEIPVIILSAKSAEEDIVKGLDLGASDYITKPFGLLEFISRINANLKKINMKIGKVLTIRDLTLDLIKHQCKVNNRVVEEMTTKEFDILQMLMESPSIVVTRKNLLKKIWNFDYPAETRTLDMHIKFIREKLSKYSDESYVETVRGVGYIINE